MTCEVVWSGGLEKAYAVAQQRRVESVAVPPVVSTYGAERVGAYLREHADTAFDLETLRVALGAASRTSLGHACFKLAQRGEIVRVSRGTYQWRQA